MADSVYDIAIRRFKRISDAWDEQKLREQQDLAFQVPEMQWTPEARQQRLQQIVGNTTLPPRPTLSIPKLDQPIQLVINQQRAAHLGLNIHPLSEDANRDTADVIGGLVRRIQRDSRAPMARDWGFDRAVKAGLGWYKVTKEWDDAGGHPFDQKLSVQRILYQQNVFADPAAEMPDFSDGDFLFEVAWLDKDTFKRMFPKSRIATMQQSQWADLRTELPEWVRVQGSDFAFMVASYWEKRHDKIRMALLKSGQVVEGDKIPKGAEILRERERETTTLWWHQMSGTEVLESEEQDGKLIPYIPCIGRELQPFDGSRRWVGIIGPAKDAQRMFNYGASNLVEVAALEPKAPAMLDPKQIDGYEEWWAQSNVRPFPYLPYSRFVDGNDYGMPQRLQIDASRLGPSQILINEGDSFVQSSTGIFDPALGKFTAGERSGKALIAVQQQADASNNHYLQNLATISIPYEGMVILERLAQTYERPGRLVEIMGEEDDSKTVILNAPFVTDPSGRPQLVGGNGQGRAAKLFDLRRGIYTVSVSVGKNFQTRTQEGQEVFGELLAKAPQFIPVLGATWMRFLDFPGAREAADILKKLRDRDFPFLNEAKDGEQTPEQMKGQLQAMQQQVQVLTQQLAQAAAEIKTDQAKQRGQLEKAQIDSETKIRLQEMDAQLQIMLAKMKAMGEALDRRHEEEMERIKQRHAVALEGAKAEHASMEGEMGRMHDDGAAEREREFDSEEAALAREYEQAEAEAGRAHESEQAERDRQTAVAQADGGGE